jgi:hypothetical protein
MAAAVVAAEFDRKKTLEGRGTTILTTSGSLLTLIFGLTVVVSGKDARFEDPWAVTLLMGSLFAFVVSAVIAIFVAVYGSKYKLADPDFLDSLTTHEMWEENEDQARRIWVRRQINTAISLRKGNNRKVKLVTWSLAAQVLAITLLSLSVAVELWPCLCPDSLKPAGSQG